MSELEQLTKQCEELEKEEKERQKNNRWTAWYINGFLLAFLIILSIPINVAIGYLMLRSDRLVFGR